MKLPGCGKHTGRRCSWKATRVASYKNRYFIRQINQINSKLNAYLEQSHIIVVHHV